MSPFSSWRFAWPPRRSRLSTRCAGRTWAPTSSPATAGLSAPATGRSITPASAAASFLLAALAMSRLPRDRQARPRDDRPDHAADDGGYVGTLGALAHPRVFA